MWMHYVIVWEVEGEQTAYLCEIQWGEPFEFVRPPQNRKILVYTWNYLEDVQFVFNRRCGIPPVKGKFAIKFLGLGEHQTMRWVTWKELISNTVQ